MKHIVIALAAMLVIGAVPLMRGQVRSSMRQQWASGREADLRLSLRTYRALDGKRGAHVHGRSGVTDRGLERTVSDDDYER